MSGGWRWLAAALVAGGMACLSGCDGTLVDADGLGRVERGDTGVSGRLNGLFCAMDDECQCEPCQSSDDCLEGLVCQEAKRKGKECGRRVCLGPES